MQMASTNSLPPSTAPDSPSAVQVDDPDKSSEQAHRVPPLIKRHTVTLVMNKSSEKLIDKTDKGAKVPARSVLHIRYGVYSIQGKRPEMEDFHTAVPDCRIDYPNPIRNSNPTITEVLSFI
jgi:hypothetical protein